LGCQFRQFACRFDPGFQRDHQRHAHRFGTVELYSKGYRLEFASSVGVEFVVDFDYVRFFPFVGYHYVFTVGYCRERVFECAECFRRKNAL
jgi:hypothetical protein